MASTAFRLARPPRRGLHAGLTFIGMLVLLAAFSLRFSQHQADATQRIAAPKLRVAAAADTGEPAAAAAAAADGTAAGTQVGVTTAAATIGSSSSGSEGELHTGVFFNVSQSDDKPPLLVELLNEPVPEDCYMEQHADYDGPALTWGLSYKKASAAQCCAACKMMRTPNERGEFCNVWVYCTSRTGKCWSPSIWDHQTGECWLKYLSGWDGLVDRAASNLKTFAISPPGGKYSAEYRAEHTTAPEFVQWSAGVIPPA